MKHAIALAFTASLALAGCAQQHSATMAERYEPSSQKQKHTRYDLSRSYSAAEIDRLNERLAPVAQRVKQASQALCDGMGSARDCSVTIVLDPEARGINAHASNRTVVVNPAMVEFAKSDTHLAFVLAHESAHQILGHTGSNHANGGRLLLGIGSAIASTPLNYSTALESEADYVGLYILAQAGYPIEKATNFWGMLSQAQPYAALTRTHPANFNRSAAMSRTAAEIRAKERKHLPLVPDLMMKKRGYV